MATKEELINNLNDDLRKEYQALIQYIQHGTVMKGAQYGDIIKEMFVHAKEEHDHAVILAEQIDNLGGVPAADMTEAQLSENDEEMLKQDLAGEEDAIARYKARIKEAEELNETALAEHLKQILVQEEEHAMDLKQALGKPVAAGAAGGR